MAGKSTSRDETLVECSRGRGARGVKLANCVVAFARVTFPSRNSLDLRVGVSRGLWITRGSSGPSTSLPLVKVAPARQRA